MKRILKYLAITTFLFAICNVGFAQKVKVEVVDFHSTNRCISCKSIEANAKKTVEAYFAEQQNVSFKVYNVDKKENSEVAKEFQAAGTSLFLKVTRDGKTEVVNLTQFAFMNARNEDNFINGLRSKIEEYLL